MVRKAVKESYDARDQAKEDMTQLVKQFELDKFERHKEWTLYSQAIEEADREGQPSSVSTGVQGMTKEQESDIRKKIRAGMLVMAKEKGVLLMAKAKVAAYNEALAFVRSQTGYEDLQDVIDLFNQYEQEKYEKLGAISRLVSGVVFSLRVVQCGAAQVAPPCSRALPSPFPSPLRSPPPAPRTHTRHTARALAFHPHSWWRLSAMRWSCRAAARTCRARRSPPLRSSSSAPSSCPSWRSRRAPARSAPVSPWPMPTA